MFIFLLLLFVATTVIGMLIRPKQNGPQASSLGDFQFPTAQEGRAIPVVFGTCKISGGNTVWWGDLTKSPVKQKSGLFASTTVGFKYYLGIQYALCQGPIDALVSLECDKRVLAFSSDTGSDPRVVYVNEQNLFGGTPTGQGGLAGEIRIYRGTDTQPSDDYLSQKQTATAFQESGGDVPAYSGTGNGGLSFISAGRSSVDETITITATGSFYLDDKTQPMYGARKFDVIGSVSGRISDDLHHDVAYEGYAFGSSKINFTISGGSIDFVPGDHWTITTLAARQSPTYKGLCYAVFKSFYVGVSSSPRPFDFTVRRCPDPLSMGASFANLGGDANPAFAVYDILTNRRYGLGVLPARIDATSFQYAATLLKNEGLGVSMLFDSPQTADQLVGEILRHADGVLYVDMQTGLWTIKLARGDYDPATIDEITVDECQSVKFSRASWEETSNQVTLNYIDRGNDFNKRTVKQEDNANIAMSGEVRTEDVTFNGLSNSSTAAIVAARCLMGFTYPLSKITVVVNRKAWKWRVGGVFKLFWVPLGLTIVFRIIRIGYGEIADGKISIDAVEDIFGLAYTFYDPPPSSGWVDPTGAPTAPASQQLEESPLQLAPSSAIYVLTLVARSEGTDHGYQVFQPVGGSDTETNEVSAFAPIGLLLGAYLATAPALDATGFKLQLGGVDLSLLESTDGGGLNLGTNLALIDEEIVSWETATFNSDGTISISNVIRGVFDTVPADHSSGSKVVFLSDGAGLTQPAPYGSDQTVSAKILPENSRGTFPLGSASYITTTTRSRYARPYPPGNIRIQGAGYGVRYTTTVGDVLVAWSSRNRLTQAAAGGVVPQDAVAIAGETGQTHKVLVLVAGVLVRTVAPATTPFTYHGSDRAADSGAAGLVTLEIYSNANGLDSYQAQTLVFEMTGFGLDFGKFFGGIQQ